MRSEKIRRLAGKILKTGESKIWIDPSETKAIEEALTKEDVRGLIGKKLVRKRRLAFHSRGAARILAAKKKKGRKRGFGKRRGKAAARTSTKRKWMENVRSQRKFLRGLREGKKITREMYTKVYKLIKGGYFRGKKQIELFVKENKG